MTRITLRTLARDVDGFLRIKHALGHAYKEAEGMLRRFQRFAKAHAISAGAGGQRWICLDATIRAWLSRPSMHKPVTAGWELGVLRHFCLYRRRRDGRGFVPERALAPQTCSSFSPHVFSHTQIRQLLKAANRHRGWIVRAILLRTVLLVLYCTGLRVGEVARLRMQDVDLEKRLFFIRDSKGKSRFVPFGIDLAQELRRYLRDRSQSANPITADTRFFGVADRCLKPQTLSAVIRKLLRQEGIKPHPGRVGPRPYDLRHTYAVHRLTEWNRKGLDVHARLPWLSAYMGHDDILGTEQYLHATPELLRLASRRFEKRFHQAQKPR